MTSPDRDVLPQNVKPVHYDLSIFDIELGGAFSYKGRVKIDLKLQKPTQSVVLNAFQLEILKASFVDSNGTAHEAKASYDTKAQRADLKLASGTIESDGVLEIDFTGTLNSDMAGFYRSRYIAASAPVPSVPKVGEHHFMFSTQFESCDARRAFPCFDEPNLKATFDFDIEIPEDQTALSNMPVKETKKGTKDGLKVVYFERTPIMSTYLLAWAFGDFTYVEAETERKYSHGKSLPVRVYTTRGLEQQGQYALEHAHKTLDYFSEIFDLEYPLPKSDLLAVHEFTHGAMENWGLVTYRTAAIFFDEKTSDPQFKKRIAYVVAHELAHQWFGNLVTMDWWSELWLNEGFATWVGWLATDHFHPEWNVWAQFVAEGLQGSLDLDSLRSSHPIEVPVRNALEIDQVFDAISYLKGSSMIRMLSAHLTVPVFLKGVSDYLKAHAYGNARTTDLWKAISKASGKDITSFMDNWIRKIGHPVLTVAEEPGQITIRQSRFLSTGDVKPDEDETLWWIPLALRTGADTSKVSSTALYAKEDTIRDLDETFYKINSDAIGFYRTNYPPDRLTKLGAVRDKLSIQDRISLVGDADALALSGAARAAGLLSLCAEFRDETEYLVWAQVIGSLDSLRSVFSHNQAIREGLNKFILHLITPILEKTGWTVKPNEGLLDGQLRALLISTAGSVGHKGTVDEALTKFEAYKSGDSTAIDPTIRLAVFATSVRHGGKGAYEHLKGVAAAEGGPDTREAALQAMGKVESVDLARDFLNFNISDSVPVQDIQTGAASLGKNSTMRAEAWTWIKANWDHIHERLAGNSIVLARFLRVSTNQFADHAVEKDISQFFANRDTEGFDMILAQVADAIKRNASYRERDDDLILEWLKSKGFA